MVSGGGLALFAVRLPCLWFTFLPPSPSPRSQSALPLRGRGRLYTLFRRGLTPPAPLRNKPARHWLRAGNRVPSGAWGAMGERRGGRRHPAGGLGGDGGGGQGRGVRRGIFPYFMPDSGIKVLERRGHGGGKLLSRSFPPPEHPQRPIAARDTEGGQRCRRG